MAQLYLKGVYYDSESGGLWFLNNSGTYEEISIGTLVSETGSDPALTALWTGTQAEYDALTPSASVLYFIHA